jgi:hypothetical protein
MTTVDKFVVEEMYIYMYATICSNNGGIVLECLHIHLILPIALIKLFIMEPPMFSVEINWYPV